MPRDNWFCPNCQALNAKGIRECVNCGEDGGRASDVEDRDGLTKPLESDE